jgi:hypothetical protein
MTPRLAIGTNVATFAYLGLAVLGGGWFAVFFSHTPLIALAIALFVLSGAALFSGANLSPGEREDRANRWVILAFTLIGLLSAYLPAYTDRKEFWTIDGKSIRWLGVVLFAAGGALRMARLCARPSVQWVGRYPAGTYARYEWCLWRHSPPKLSGDCSSTRWGGPSPFVRGSACCSPHCLSRRSSRAYMRKRCCCTSSSAASTIPTAAVRPG